MNKLSNKIGKRIRIAGLMDGLEIDGTIFRESEHGRCEFVYRNKSGICSFMLGKKYLGKGERGGYSLKPEFSEFILKEYPAYTGSLGGHFPNGKYLDRNDVLVQAGL